MPPVFGTAGSSDAFIKTRRSSDKLPEYLKDFGLDHLEYQCGRGVRVSDKLAQSLKANAEEQGITLSLHAPYFISLSSAEEQKRDNSIGYILDSCSAANRIGAERIVIHSGSCGKMSRAEAMELAKDTLLRAREKAVEQGYEHIIFCPETMGKTGQLGDLDEVLGLCALDESFLPCIDFGHLNARSFGGIKSYDDYARIIDQIGERLGEERLRHFHAHFSKIMFTCPGGEKKHLTFDANEGYGPDYEPLMELLYDRGLEPVIICESAGTQDFDALTMKRYYYGI